MRTLILAFAAIASVETAVADTYVRGHIRNDGTYVQPHHRTNPNNSTLDNFSTRGNTNPYTGHSGTVDPYKSPSTYGTTPSPYGGYGNSRR